MKHVVFYLTTFTLLISGIACSKKEEVSVVEAVKKYHIHDLTVDEALTAQRIILEKEGVKTELHWSYEVVPESEPVKILVKADLKDLSGKKKDQAYSWELVKNASRSSEKGSHYDMKPHNRSAQKLMYTQRTEVQKWASFVFGNLSQPQKN